LAIIGIYYFRDGAYLKQELQKLIDENIIVKGEYQLTDALENMKKACYQFHTGTVDAWLDCGNKVATVDTNHRYMDFIKDKPLVSTKAKLENTIIIEPVFIDDDAVVSNSVIGPHVSVGKGTNINHSVVSNSIIQENSKVQRANIADSMIGSHVVYEGRGVDLSIGDYTQIKE